MLFMQAGLLSRAYAAPIVYRSKATSPGAVSAVTKPTGIGVGDIAFVYTGTWGGTGALEVVTTGGTPWTRISHSIGGQIYFASCKILDATDVANAWSTINESAVVTAHGSEVVALAWEPRAATTITDKGSTTNGAGPTTLTVPGFAPALESRGIISWFIDRAGAAAAQPSLLTTRHSALGVFIADGLGSYAGGPLIYTGGGASGQVARILEIT